MKVPLERKVESLMIPFGNGAFLAEDLKRSEMPSSFFCNSWCSACFYCFRVGGGNRGNIGQYCLRACMCESQ